MKEPFVLLSALQQGCVRCSQSPCEKVIKRLFLRIIWLFRRKAVSLPALRESFKDITVMRAKQEIFISEAKKLQDYLVVPNNLLLSLSLSLEIQACSHFSFFLIAYAREAGRATSINKGLNRVPFVPLFVPFCQAGKRQHKTEFIHQTLVNYEENSR